MFEQSILGAAPKTRKAWTMAASLACQAVGVGFAILIPLVAFDKLPQTRMGNGPLMTPPTAPPREPKIDYEKHSVKVVDVQWQSVGRRLTLPNLKNVPATAQRIFDAATPPEVGCDNCVTGGIPGGSGPDGVVGGLGRLGDKAYQPKVPDETPAVKKTPPRNDPPPLQKIGGNVMEARLIYKAAPVYPPLAITARVQGVVKLQAVIDRDGRIRELSVISGHPLLVKAALEAVQRWTYRPTTLNGDPVEVLTTVDVNFILGR